MMKIVLLLIVLSLSTGVKAQKKYQYYFIEIRTTGKLEVQLSPETGVQYMDIDTLLVENRETKKNGAIILTGKKYESYSAAFNTLSNAGLEFVQFVNLSTVGGATAMIAGDIKVNYIIWRKEVSQ